MQDPRLSQPPFSTNPVRYIVARHKIRTAQAFHNAMMEAARLREPVYVLKALDVAKVEDAHLFTEQWHTKLLDTADLSFCKRTPGILALYEGMRLLLNTKDCLRLSLMNGCECILEQIVFAESEVLPTETVAGAVYELQYLPTALLLRAVGAAWTLPEDRLPTLPPEVDRRGLFLLHPSPVSLQLEISEDVYINIKRTGYQIAPADTRIDYGAQGEGWPAVVGDLARPPRVDLPSHWVHIYVILSRAKSMDGFLAIRLPTRDEMNVRPPQYLLDECDRLLGLEQKSTTRLKDYISKLSCNIPAKVLAVFDGNAEEREMREVVEARARQAPIVHATSGRKRLRFKQSVPSQSQDYCRLHTGTDDCNSASNASSPEVGKRVMNMSCFCSAQ